MANGTPTLWFGWSGEVIESGSVTTSQITQDHRAYVITDLSHADHDEYYNGFANLVHCGIDHEWWPDEARLSDSLPRVAA